MRMQVLRYKLGQFYDAHRDYWDPDEFPDKHRFLHPKSNAWYNRHATLLWYLQRPEEGSGSELDIDTHTHMIIHVYIHMHIYNIHMLS